MCVCNTMYACNGYIPCLYVIHVGMGCIMGCIMYVYTTDKTRPPQFAIFNLLFLDMFYFTQHSLDCFKLKMSSNENMKGCFVD